MALFYKMRLNNNQSTPLCYKRWYARAYHTETTTLRQLAERMQDNCTVKRADILAVLSELADTMRDELQNGHKVYIEGLGTFKMGMRSRGVDRPEDYRPDRDVMGLHIIFSPETTRQQFGRRRTALTEGTTLLPLPK